MQLLHCNMCEGVLSHNMKRFQIDGNKVVLDRTTHDQKVEINEIEQAEVYAIDFSGSAAVARGEVGPVCPATRASPSEQPWVENSSRVPSEQHLEQ